ncbi:structure-specific endonuclease subunit slx1 [Periplaneta americana]|uniref:structure-specific endonuclease subunit slx1 n=1 Tax=Periplaneta americana TaxID=6978 RepID=UPI0037E833A7
MSKNENVVVGFFGVYLLYCTNPKYKGRTYIGYTVDPNRRIKQHNKGKHAGGAWRTSNRGPWEMVLIIHGFPNDISALRFEWAWQHPQRSRRLRHVMQKKPREKPYDFCLRVLSEMLQVGPWNRLALTIRWLKQEFVREFPVDSCPPLHMPIAYGPVVSKRIVESQETTSQSPPSTTFKDDDVICLCSLCDEAISPHEKMTCISPSCLLVVHVICLARRFQKGDIIIPLEGDCPACNTHVLWGDLVRKKKGCYNNLISGAADSCEESD